METQLSKIATCGQLKTQLFENDDVNVFEKVRFQVSTPILGLQPRDKTAMLVVNTKETVLLNLHQDRVHFPAERNVFVLDHQYGGCGVTCKLAIRHENGVFKNFHPEELK